MKRLLIFIGLTLALSAVLISSVPVLASPAPSNALRVHIERSTSSNWSGYAEAETGSVGNITGVAGSVTFASGTWTVPAVTGPNSRGSYYSSAWVGIDGYSDNTVEQIGTEQDWSNGHASYYAWYEMYPSAGYEIPDTVKPGDIMTATVSYSTGTFTLSLIDTRGQVKAWGYSTTQKLSSAKEETAEWIMEAPSSRGVLPLADFGTINFSGCIATINSVPCNITTTGAYDPITMVDNGAKATPSLLSPSSFSVTYSGTASKNTSPYQDVHIR